MKRRPGDAWGTFLLRMAVLGAVIFGAVRLAVARDGVAGGAARSFVTVAGTVRGATGTPQMTFRFRRALGDGGVSPGVCEPTVPLLVGEGGAFSAQVPLDSTASRCPDDLFDGRDVVVELAVNGTPIVGTFPVNPVPYAVHADVAAVARQAESATGSLATVVGSSVRRIDCSWIATGIHSENVVEIPAAATGAQFSRSLLLIESMSAFDQCAGPSGSFNHAAKAYWVTTSTGYPATAYSAIVREVTEADATRNNACTALVSITVTADRLLDNRVRIRVDNADTYPVSCTIIPLR